MTMHATNHAPMYAMPGASAGVVAPTDYHSLYGGRGFGAAPEGALTTAQLSGGGLAGVGGAAIYGGLIGGMAAADWDGAGTGALGAAGITGMTYGVSYMVAAGEGEVPKSAQWVGTGLLALGAGLFGWGVYRWNKQRK